MVNEIKGDLIELAKQGEFDVVIHGCNCFCTMGAGIAPKMAKEFGCNKYDKESEYYKGDINKLGTIEYGAKILEYYTHLRPFENDDVIPPRVLKFMLTKPYINEDFKYVIIVNAYTQYYYGKNHSDGVEKPLDYEALTLCMRKINHIFKGKHIGLPGLIGCGLAGGKEEIVVEIIKKELKDCDVTIVYLNR